MKQAAGPPPPPAGSSRFLQHIGTMTALNAGALGSLYRLGGMTGDARDSTTVRYSGTTGDGTRVNIWALPPGRVDLPLDGKAFAATMASIAELNVPGLARIVGWGVASDGTLHAAYEHGASLAGESPPATQVAATGLPIARALATVHSAGKVHGAVSGEFLSLHHDGTPILGGMGIFEALCAAGMDPRDASSILTRAPYASPEQQAGDAPTALSDVYSLGACLYELLTGKPPFGGRTTSYVMASVLSDAQVDPDTPVDSPAQDAGPAVDVILRAIERAPEDRWPSMDAFAEALAASEPARPAAPARQGCLPVAAAIAMFALGVAASL